MSEVIVEEQKAVNWNREPLPGNNWVEFEGSLLLGEFWAVQDADKAGDTRMVATHLCKIIKGWSFEGDPRNLEYDTLDSWAGFDLAMYRAVAKAAGRWLGRDHSGN